MYVYIYIYIYIYIYTWRVTYVIDIALRNSIILAIECFSLQLADFKVIHNDVKSILTKQHWNCVFKWTSLNAKMHVLCNVRRRLEIWAEFKTSWEKNLHCQPPIHNLYKDFWWFREVEFITSTCGLCLGWMSLDAVPLPHDIFNWRKSKLQILNSNGIKIYISMYSLHE